MKTLLAWLQRLYTEFAGALADVLLVCRRAFDRAELTFPKPELAAKTPSESYVSSRRTALRSPAIGASDRAPITAKSTSAALTPLPSIDLASFRNELEALRRHMIEASRSNSRHDDALLEYLPAQAEFTGNLARAETGCGADERGITQDALIAAIRLLSHGIGGAPAK